MSRAEKLVTLYNPNGTEVEVNEERAKVLKDRGFTTSKPRKPANSNLNNRKDAVSGAAMSDLQAELDKMRAENEQLKADAEAAKAGQK